MTDILGKVESYNKLDEFERRHITLEEAEVVKNRILFPKYLKDWVGGELEINGTYWDHKGRCNELTTRFNLARSGITYRIHGWVTKFLAFDIPKKEYVVRKRIKPPKDDFPIFKQK